MYVTGSQLPDTSADEQRRQIRFGIGQTCKRWFVGGGGEIKGIIKNKFPLDFIYSRDFKSGMF